VSVATKRQFEQHGRVQEQKAGGSSECIYENADRSCQTSEGRRQNVDSECSVEQADRIAPGCKRQKEAQQLRAGSSNSQTSEGRVQEKAQR